MAFTLYTSMDGDAPVLEDAAGSLLNILRQCLVLGYGDKAPAGWAEQINADLARGAFRSQDPASPQHWFYIDDSKSGSISTVAYARAAFDFAGWDGNGDPQFTDPYPTLTQRPEGTVFHKSHTGSGHQWAVVADGRTCWWMSTPQGAAPLTNWSSGLSDLYVQLQGFGDTVSLMNHPAPSFIAGGVDESQPREVPQVLRANGSSGGTSTATNSYFFMAGNHDLSDLSINPRTIFASGDVRRAPDPRFVPFIPTQRRIFWRGNRIERLRGLQDAITRLNSDDQFEAVFGAMDAGNPGLRFIGAGESERLFIITGRRNNNNESGLICFDLGDD